EPDELGMRLRDVELAARLPAAALLDPAGRFRGRAVGPLLARHGGALRPAEAHSCRSNAAVSIPKYVGASYESSSGRKPSPRAPWSISICQRLSASASVARCGSHAASSPSASRRTTSWTSSSYGAECSLKPYGPS